jgi:hypothetical protein
MYLELPGEKGSAKARHMVRTMKESGVMMAPTARSESSWQSKQRSVDPLRLPRKQADHCDVDPLLTGLFHGWASGSDGHCLQRRTTMVPPINIGA